jgi:hypothetical protein
MEYRCPLCSADLKKRKLSHAIVTRMEFDCSHCKGAIRLNVHRSEVIVAMLNFGIIIVLGAFAYWFQSQGLLLVTIAAAMLGTLALPVLERVYLKNWPRYAPQAQRPDT